MFVKFLFFNNTKMKKIAKEIAKIYEIESAFYNESKNNFYKSS